MKVKSVCCVVAALGLVACARVGARVDETQIDAGRTPEQERNLATFDDLDFNIYSGQRWSEFHKSHADDIIVHYPDSSTTIGLAAHVEMLKPQFAFAPGTAISVHPIRLADGDYTAVQGIMEGTFSAPMAMPDGGVIAPTGKRFRLEMLTVGRWEGGVMFEEWLYWDNLAFLRQIGLSE